MNLDDLERRLVEMEKATAQHAPQIVDPLGLALIETQTLGGAGTFTFTVPATYRHLVLRGSVRGTTAAYYDQLSVRPNADGTAANYWARSLYYLGAGTISQGWGANIVMGLIDSASSNANLFSAVDVWIMNYRLAMYKFIKGGPMGYMGDFSQGNSGFGVYENVWKSTSAITSLVVQGYSTANLATGSSLSLYGVAG